MQAVQLIYRAELRSRWRSWLALVLLVAVAGGVVMAAVAAGRRTSAAFPAYVARYGFNVDVFTTTALPTLDRLPGVESVAQVPTYFPAAAAVGSRNVTQTSDFTMYGAPSASSHAFLKLLSGRLPLASHPTEVLASFTLAQQFGARVGSVITMPMYSPAQSGFFSSGNTTVAPEGPTLRLTVVGIEAFATDFPAGPPSYTIFAGPGFDRRFGRELLTARTYLVRLRSAADDSRFTEQAAHLAGRAVFYTQSADAVDAVVQQSIAPQVLGWELLALLAALAALAVLAQAFGREARDQAEAYSALRALGITPRELFALGLLTTASVSALGALGATLLAWVLSPLTPVGLARIAAPSTGFAFDPLVLVGGAVAVAVVCVALGALPAWRAVRATSDRPLTEATRRRASPAFASWRTGTGALPSALVGTRRALQRGTGPARLPVASALLGSGLAVTALVATMVFGASLSHLTRTPSLYGQLGQVQLSQGMTGNQAQAIVNSLEADPAVERISYGVLGPFLSIRGVSVSAVVGQSARGPLDFAVASGHLPDGPGQIALGHRTLSQAGAHVGSVIPVTIESPSGAPVRARFQVVGTATFSPSLQTGGMGDGAVMLISGAEDAFCASRSGGGGSGGGGGGGGSAQCHAAVLSALRQIHSWGIVVSVAPGAAGRAALASITQRYSQWVGTRVPPTDLVNFGEAVNFPLLFGIALALFGAATLTHLLAASVARRRRDVALLKSVGFVRRQVAAAVCWQATTIGVVAVAFGIPIGIAAGRLVWHAFAVNLGAVPDDVVPIGLVAALAGGVIVAANVLAGVPAVTAARMRPAEALREG